MIDNPFQRKQHWRHRGKGPGGRNLCHCGCGREVSPPRRTCFSNECLTAWKLINDPATIAAFILKRDRGICAHCGLDTCPRKARINACPPGWWYADRVGQVVNIEFIDRDGYWAREGGVYNAINKIRPEDATLLPLES